MADNLYDPELRKARLCERECDTCIFKPESNFRSGDGALRPGRFKQLVSTAVQDEGYIVCHESSFHHREAMCRGFYNRFSTNTTRVLTRLGLAEVPCPSIETGGS